MFPPDLWIYLCQVDLHGVDIWRWDVNNCYRVEANWPSLEPRLLCVTASLNRHFICTLFLWKTYQMNVWHAGTSIGGQRQINALSCLCKNLKSSVKKTTIDRFIVVMGCTVAVQTNDWSIGWMGQLEERGAMSERSKGLDERSRQGKVVRPHQMYTSLA